MEASTVARQTDTSAQLAQSFAEATDGNSSTSRVPPTVFSRRTGPARRCANSLRPYPPPGRRS
jgi:hypothetical protein